MTYKFRLIKDNKIVGYEEHMPAIPESPMRIYHISPDHRLMVDITNSPSGYIEHDSKDMFTERHDSDYAEVYSGDRVSYKGYVATIEYCDGAYELISSTGRFMNHLWNLEDKSIKVVGTIHDEVQS